MTTKVIDCQDLGNAADLLAYLQRLEQDGYNLSTMYVRVGDRLIDPNADHDEIQGAQAVTNILSDESATYDLILI
jgi:hypothetical protein